MGNILREVENTGAIVFEAERYHIAGTYSLGSWPPIVICRAGLRLYRKLYPTHEMVFLFCSRQFSVIRAKKFLDYCCL